MKLVDMDEPGSSCRPGDRDQPRLTGICGSDSRGVPWTGRGAARDDNPMKGVLLAAPVPGPRGGCRCGGPRPEAEGLSVGRPGRPQSVVVVRAAGQRRCARLPGGRLQPLLLVRRRSDPARIHIGPRRRERRLTRRMSAHDSQLFKVPTTFPTSSRCSPTLACVALDHAVNRRSRAAR